MVKKEKEKKVLSQSLVLTLHIKGGHGFDSYPGHQCVVQGHGPSVCENDQVCRKQRMVVSVPHNDWKRGVNMLWAETSTAACDQSEHDAAGGSHTSRTSLESWHEYGGTFKSYWTCLIAPKQHGDKCIVFC